MKSRRHIRRPIRKSSYKNRNWDSFKRDIVIEFLEFLNTIKLYHWKTHSYSTHQATDALYDKMNKSIDKFVEVLLGKNGDRVHLDNVKTLRLRTLNSSSQLKQYLTEFKSKMVGLDNSSALTSQGMTNSDLLNIRDEILADINQFLYLLTFK
jgi:hypothetical protein